MASFKKIVKNLGRARDKATLGIAPKVRKALHLRGKNWQSLLKYFRSSSTNSAGSYSGDVYGPTGSIVGRY